MNIAVKESTTLRSNGRSLEREERLEFTFDNWTMVFDEPRLHEVLDNIEKIAVKYPGVWLLEKDSVNYEFAAMVEGTKIHLSDRYQERAVMPLKNFQKLLLRQ